MITVNASCATNFNLAKGDSSAGGENAQKRYEELCSAYEANAGVMTRQQVTEVLRRTARRENGRRDGPWLTIRKHKASATGLTAISVMNIRYRWSMPLPYTEATKL